MSPTSSQQWTRRIRYSDQHIRVSDAERNAVADRLAAHYSDGRLDQAEFDDRVGRAMAAKTRGDLDGLFDDLPDTGLAGTAGKGGRGDQAVPYRRRRGRGLGRTILLVVLAIVALNIVGHAIAAVAFFTFSWFWIAALVAIVLIASRSTRHHHRDRDRDPGR